MLIGQYQAQPCNFNMHSSSFDASLGTLKLLIDKQIYQKLEERNTVSCITRQQMLFKKTFATRQNRDAVVDINSSYINAFKLWMNLGKTRFGVPTMHYIA